MGQMNRLMGFDPLLSVIKGWMRDAMSMGHCTYKFPYHSLGRVG